MAADLVGACLPILGGKTLPQECLTNLRAQSDLVEAEARIAHLVSVLGERDIELDNARQVSGCHWAPGRGQLWFCVSSTGRWSQD